MFLPGFALSQDGRYCENQFKYIVYTVYGSLAIIVVILLVQMFVIWRRPSSPERMEVLRVALMNREQGIPKDPNGKPWPFWTTNVISQDISGLGISQYFTWNLWFLGVAIVLSIGAYYAHEQTRHDGKVQDALDSLACGVSSRAALIAKAALLQDPNWGDGRTRVDIDDVEGLDDLEAKDFLPVERRMFRYLLPSYFAVIALSLGISWWQEKTIRSWLPEHGSLHYFACLLTGLPDDATDPGEIMRHVKEHAARVKGVSPGYHVKDCFDDLEILADEWEREERRLDEEEGPQEAALLLKQPVRAVKERTSRAYAQASKMVESLFVHIGQREHHKKEDTVKFLESLKSSGRAIVVMETQKAAEELVKNGVKPLRGHQLKVTRLDSSPVGVLWQNFQSGHLYWRIFKASGLFVVVMIGWLLLFVPYAMDVMMVARTPGMKSTVPFADLVLGLFIAVGNCIMATTVEVVTDWAGVQFLGERQVIVLVLGFGTVFLNTILDLLVMVMMTRGAELDNAMAGTRVGSDEIMVDELYATIWPSYLLTPYIAAPFFMYVLPRYLNSWIVRSRPVEQGVANRSLESQELDLVSRYYDYVNNLSISVLMLAFSSEKAVLVCYFLIFNIIFLHILDRYLLLRVAATTYYRNAALGRWFSRLLVVPTGVLAAITCHWGVKAKWLPPGCELAGAALHAALYLLLLEAPRKLLQPDQATREYSEVAKSLKDHKQLHDYWNTNLALCLRHRHLNIPVPGADDLVYWKVRTEDGGHPESVRRAQTGQLSAA